MSKKDIVNCRMPAVVHIWTFTKKRAAWVAVFLALTFLSGQIHAVPASPDPFEAEHPDGGQRQFWLRGDEFFSWTEDADGIVYVAGERNRRGLHYAELDEGNLVPRRDALRRRLHRDDILPTVHERSRAVRVKMSRDGFMAPAANDGRPLSAPPLPSIPSPQKLLVVVVSFSDSAAVSSASHWSNHFFGASGKTVNTYYRAVSKNQFYFTPAPETQDTADDGIVYVTLARAHPNRTELDETCRTAAREALIEAAAHVNFASFDTNGNGSITVDEMNLVFIFAGYEASYNSQATPIIWGHSWSGMNVTLHGVRFNDSYCVQGERHGAPSNYHFASIGIFCHELGHNLGLEDLYDITSASRGVGVHCVMGNGSWGMASGDNAMGETPVFMSAHSRYFLRFTSPKVVASGTHALRSASSATLADEEVLKVNTSVASEYFLVENRQLTGFDQGLQMYFDSVVTSGGVAIWHIDETKYGYNANANVFHKAVDLEEANEGSVGQSQLDNNVNYGIRQHYYYSGNTTQFNVTTIPSSIAYNGMDTGVSISVPGTSGTTMNVTVDCVVPEVISLETALDNTTLAFTHGGDAEWFAQTATRHYSASAAQSGKIGHNQSSVMQTTLTGPGSLSFWWRVSSEENYDYLRFNMDDVTQLGSISGEVDWEQKTFSIPDASHTVQWVYEKNARVSDGSDCGWVDQVVWSNAFSTICVITTVSSPPAGGTTNGGGTFIAGTSCTLTATPNIGYTFENWQRGNTTVSTSPIHTFSVTDNRTFTANFTANTYTVTFDGHGITPSPTTKTVTYNTAYDTLPGMSRAGHRFTGWFNALSNGTEVTSATTVTTASDHTLHAYWFEETVFVSAITVDASGDMVLELDDVEMPPMIVVCISLDLAEPDGWVDYQEGAADGVITRVSPHSVRINLAALNHPPAAFFKVRLE